MRYIYKILKDKNYQFKNTIPSEAVLQKQKRNKDFLEQIKAEGEFVTTRPSLQEILKRVLRVKGW